MMAGAAYQKSNLRELLDRFVIAQRQDIHAYCGGHLNQSNIYRPIDQAPFANWTSVCPKKLTPLIPLDVHNRQDDKRSEENMTDSLFKFALGASGLQLAMQTVEETDHNEPCRSSNSSAARRSRETSAFSQRLVNAVDQQSSTLSAPGKDAQVFEIHPARSADDVSSHSCRSNTPLAHIQAAKGYRGISNPVILLGNQETVTKKDQLKKMRMFDIQVLRRSDAFQQHVLTGVHAVDSLEKRLAKSLNDLDDDAPSFHRLQVYTDVFAELIESSPTFRYPLHKIKDAYENHLASLLDSQSDGHSTLQADITRLSVSHANVAPKLEMETERVHRLEQRARELLEENESLRRELAKELEFANQPQLEMPASVPAHPEDLEPSELIGQLHAAIWERLEAVRELRSKLRTEYVPSSICTYLTQCLKDTDVETQKILSQKEYFERSIAELDQDLRDAVEAADTTERDAKRIWTRIQIIKSDSTSTAAIGTVDLQDSDEESAKWNWYIS